MEHNEEKRSRFRRPDVTEESVMSDNLTVEVESAPAPAPAPAPAEEPAKQASPEPQSDDRVKLEYTGGREKVNLGRLGIYMSGTVYNVRPAMAKLLMEIKNPDGSPAFKKV